MIAVLALAAPTVCVAVGVAIGWALHAVNMRRINRDPVLDDINRHHGSTR